MDDCMNKNELQDILNKTCSIGAEQWGMMAIRSDPAFRWLKGDDIDKAISVSRETGKKEAQNILNEYGSAKVKEIAVEMGIVIDYFKTAEHRDYLSLAQYRSKPPTILINQVLINKIEELIMQRGLCLNLKGNSIEDIFIAHELFHHIEQTNKRIGLHDLKFPTWRLLGRQFYTGLICTGEIAAFAFAQELFQLEYFPQALEVLAVYLSDINLFNKYVKGLESVIGTNSLQDNTVLQI